MATPLRLLNSTLRGMVGKETRFRTVPVGKVISFRIKIGLIIVINKACGFKILAVFGVPLIFVRTFIFLAEIVSAETSFSAISVGKVVCFIRIIRLIFVIKKACGFKILAVFSVPLILEWTFHFFGLVSRS